MAEHVVRNPRFTIVKGFWTYSLAQIFSHYISRWLMLNSKAAGTFGIFRK